MSTNTTTTETMRVEAGSIPYHMDQPKSPNLDFLDFPCEIRMNVYRHLFVWQEPIRPRQPTPGEILKHSIMFTCKKISEEAIEVLYRENTFAFGPGRYTKYTTTWGSPSTPPKKTGEKAKSYKVEVIKGKRESDPRREAKQAGRDAARVMREAAKASARWKDWLEPKVSVSTESDLEFFFRHTSRANASLVRRVLLRDFPWWVWRDTEVLDKNVLPIVDHLECFSRGLDSVEIAMSDDTARSLRGAMKKSQPSQAPEDQQAPDGIHPADEVRAFLTTVYARMTEVEGIRSLSVKLRPLSKDPDRNQISVRRILKECGWIKVKVDETHPLLPWIEEELGVDLRVRECMPEDLYKLLHYKEYIHKKHGVVL
ncbi:hypothetical protein CKAH01_11958 [Colletotrichum kahawae]|uniref:Uncharacterized protein n=1 Tax=Colletotrichum kahawae TaxID=34407 RepID=A0AAE0DD25_COLKA|nr:hypothetical protein CKAH01_11958 [Colletotrichum kahawae]